MSSGTGFGKNASWSVPPHLHLSILRAAAAGVLGTAALEVFLLGLAPRLGLGMLHHPQLLGACLSGALAVPQGKLLLVTAWLIFLLGGIGWGSIYASYFSHRLPGEGWLQGLTYGGLGVFLICSLVFFPLIGLFPLGQAPAPGILGLGLSGARVALANFLGHCLFGLILGIVYRRELVF